MKIAYIADSKIPSREANSVHVMKMCSALAAHGNAVTLVVPDYTYNQIESNVSNVFEHYGVPENFTIKRISLKFSRFSRFKTCRKHYRMARYVAVRNKFDRIYSRDLTASFFICCVFRRPLYFEYHTSIELGSKADKMFRKMIKSKHFKKLIVITQALKRYYLSHYSLDDEQIYVAPDGADAPPESILPIELIEKSSEKFHVGYTGHLHKGRGIELLGDMARNCPFAFFHIIGGNDEDIAYWKDKYIGIDNIHFYGYVPPSMTVRYGKCMNVLIAPYQNAVYILNGIDTSRWMSPLKVFEYMALGKPIISSDVPVLKEILIDGTNSLLCPPDDAATWSEAIKRLYEDKKLADTLAANALNELFTQYAWSVRAEKIIRKVIEVTA